MLKINHTEVIESFQIAIKVELGIHEIVIDSFDSCKDHNLESFQELVRELMSSKMQSSRLLLESEVKRKVYFSQDGDPRRLVQWPVEKDITVEEVDGLYLQAGEAKNKAINKAKETQHASGKELSIFHREVTELKRNFEWLSDCAFAAKELYLRNSDESKRPIGTDYSFIKRDSLIDAITKKTLFGLKVHLPGRVS
ncbi:MAG: hypothetical protein K940chlam3_01192 [Chlamydiae bacterium]|nr:hypothetical protein [Chlamydiota bacterium]